MPGTRVTVYSFQDWYYRTLPPSLLRLLSLEHKVFIKVAKDIVPAALEN